MSRMRKQRRRPSGAELGEPPLQVVQLTQQPPFCLAEAELCSKKAEIVVSMSKW
jgi:hypothetical protein